MKRFLVVLGILLLGVAAALAYYVNGMEWSSAAPFDVIGFLWLLQNFPKLMGWIAVWIFAALGLACFWYSLRVPTVSFDLESEQKRLLGHVLADPPRRGD